MDASQQKTDQANRLPAQLDRSASTSRDASSSGLRRLRQRLDQLTWNRQQVDRELEKVSASLVQTKAYLDIASDVTSALDVLSQKLFEEILTLLREKLSIAIEEVLNQPVKFRAEASFRRGAANVDFSIERDGFEEDVMRGQGGSVQNVLSVGLRLFALASLDSQEHRRFLVLDEQDCWLRPELVPRLVNIVYRAAKELNFQVIMISHHDLKLFEDYADKIYHFEPENSMVKVSRVIQRAMEQDQE